MNTATVKLNSIVTKWHPEHKGCVFKLWRCFEISIPPHRTAGP